jgi:non-ribosomal peptide synthetase component F
VTLAPEQPAYLIYTSGSTGRPKGIPVPHRQILNRLAWMWRDYPFAADEVGCQKTALNFVDSLWEIFGYLLKGIPTVILPDAIVRDPARLVEALADHAVTRLWLVPSLLNALLERYPDLAQRLPALRFWVTSGEALPTSLFHRFVAALPQSTLYNLYGTSEVWDVTWFDPGLPHERWRGPSVPIGRPICNMRCYLLDARQQPVPTGVIGELSVGGEALGEGYLNLPVR